VFDSHIIGRTQEKQPKAISMQMGLWLFLRSSVTFSFKERSFMKLDAQAKELNEIILASNRHVYSMLSEQGKNIYFPKRGILAQTAEASGKAINATIGTALEDSGTPMCLESLWKQFSLQKKNIFSYAPSPGKPEIRAIWKDMLYKKNPSLAGKTLSLPVVTSALSHGLSMAGYLFCGTEDRIIIPDLYWENYDLIFSHSYGSSIVNYPTFAGQSYNVAGIRDRLAALPRGKKVVLLNFPNNPTGYTVTVSEAYAIKDILVAAAESGDELVVFSKNRFLPCLPTLMRGFSA
jgi:aspartate/methionine/tyrosine aminotransferase